MDVEQNPHFKGSIPPLCFLKTSLHKGLFAPAQWYTPQLLQKNGARGSKAASTFRGLTPGGRGAKKSFSKEKWRPYTAPAASERRTAGSKAASTFRGLGGDGRGAKKNSK